jgi:hypothetical protein
MISIPVSDRIIHWFEYVDDKLVGEVIVYKPGEWIHDLKRLIDASSNASQN